MANKKNKKELGPGAKKEVNITEILDKLQDWVDDKEKGKEKDISEYF